MCHLSNSANVLLSVFRGEAKVFVQSCPDMSTLSFGSEVELPGRLVLGFYKPDVVSIKPISCNAPWHQILFKSKREGGLSWITIHVKKSWVFLAPCLPQKGQWTIWCSRGSLIFPAKSICMNGLSNWCCFLNLCTGVSCDMALLVEHICGLLNIPTTSTAHLNFS